METVRDFLMRAQVIAVTIASLLVLVAAQDGDGPIFGTDSPNFNPCSDDHQDACNTIFNFRQDLSSFPLAISTAETHVICETYTNYEACVLRYLPNCPLHEKLKHRAINETVRYVCDKRLHDFELHSVCFSQMGVSKGISECSQSYQSDKQDTLEKSARGELTEEETYTWLCTYRQYYLACSENKVLTLQCGPEAGDLIKEYFRRITMADFDTYQCYRYFPSSRPTAVPPSSPAVKTIHWMSVTSIVPVRSKTIFPTSNAFSVPTARPVIHVHQVESGDSHNHTIGIALGAVGALIGIAIIILLVFVLIKLKVLTRLRRRAGSRQAANPVVFTNGHGPARNGALPQAPIVTVLPSAHGPHDNPTYDAPQGEIHISPNVGPQGGMGPQGNGQGPPGGQEGNGGPNGGLYLYESLTYPRPTGVNEKGSQL